MDMATGNPGGGRIRYIASPAGVEQRHRHMRRSTDGRGAEPQGDNIALRVPNSHGLQR